MPSEKVILDSLLNSIHQFRESGIYDLSLIVITIVATSLFSCKIWRKRLRVRTNEWEFHGKKQFEQATLFEFTCKVHISNLTSEPIKLNIIDEIVFYNSYFDRDDKELHFSQKDKLLTIEGYKTEEVILNSCSKFRNPKNVKLYFRRDGIKKSYKCKIEYIDTNMRSMLLDPYS